MGTNDWNKQKDSRLYMFLNSSQKLITHEVLSTVMYKVCAIINSCPLATISYDAEDPTILTPSILLDQSIQIWILVLRIHL